MVRRSRWIGVLFAVALLAAACGDDDDDDGGGGAAPEETDDGGESEGEGGEVSLDEELEIGEGVVLPLPDCPSDWSDTGGIDGDTVLIGMTLPESGPVASLALVDDGIQAWFDDVNANDPIDGKQIQIIKRDDAFDPARTVQGVEEMLETEEPFAISSLIGTANNLAVRDLLDEECMPQLLNATGFPAWGDPENYPWTIGGLLSYDTEARMWCNDIVDALGEGATVAGLFMDNDFGQSYLNEMEACAEDGLIDLVETVRHDPAAPDVTDEMTTLAATDAQGLVLGTTGAPCSQSMAALASSGWEPRTYIHGGCQTIATYFTPVDPAGEGVIVAQTQREIGTQGDPAVDKAIEVMEAAGLDPFAGASYSGIIAGAVLEQILRAAAELEGGLTRTNLMRAVWNLDAEHPYGVPGATLRSDGANDAYLIEAALLGQYVPPAAGEASGHYEPVGDVINLEGETGVFEGE